MHYWDRDDSKIHLTSTDSRDPYGSTLDALIGDLELMRKAFDKPVIDLDTIEYYEPTVEEKEKAYNDGNDEEGDEG